MHAAAHSAFQLRAALKDSTNVCFEVTGARYRLFLTETESGDRPLNHLLADYCEDGIWTAFRTHALFLV